MRRLQEFDKPRQLHTVACLHSLYMGTVGDRNKADSFETRIGHRFVMALDTMKEFFVRLAFVDSIAIVILVAGQVSTIDTARSKLLVHVSKSGVFSGFADNHEVEAPISEGTVDERGRRVKFSVDSRRMKVLDPQLSPDKRQQVQERMLGPEVLNSLRFPEITFESSHVEQEGEGKFRVDGQLSLHGVTKPVSILAQAENGRYTGRFALKQRDFGITPVSIAGGTVKVKDELTIEFDVRIASSTTESRSLLHSPSKVMSLAMFAYAQQSGQLSGVPNRQEPTTERQTGTQRSNPR